MAGKKKKGRRSKEDMNSRKRNSVGAYSIRPYISCPSCLPQMRKAVEVCFLTKSIIGQIVQRKGVFRVSPIKSPLIRGDLGGLCFPEFLQPPVPPFRSTELTTKSKVNPIV